MLQVRPPGKTVKPSLSQKALLASTEPSVIAELAKWRKEAHYLHANALAQGYFVATDEWSVLRGKCVMLGKRYTRCSPPWPSRS